MRLRLFAGPRIFCITFFSTSRSEYFVRLGDPHARDCSASDATRIGPDRDMAGPNSATRNVSKGDGGYLPLVVRITVGRGDFAEGT
jgi:hypothetical protein